MKDGYYWARYCVKDDKWVMMAVSNGYMYNVGPVGIFDFGTVDEFVKRYPGIELVEIEKPKEKVFTVDFTNIRRFMPKTQFFDSKLCVTLVPESSVELFLDEACAMYRESLEEIMKESIGEI